MSKNFYFYILWSTLLFSCHKKESFSDGQFKNLYQRFSANKYSSTDSLINIIKTCDSLSKFDLKIEWLKIHTQGVVSVINSDYDKGISYYKTAEEIATTNKFNDSIIALTFGGLGHAYKNKSDYTMAIDYFLKSLKIYEKQKNETKVQATKTFMATTYFKKGDAQKAEQILKETTQAKDPIVNLLATHALANFYGESGLIDSAIAIDNKIISANIKNNELAISPFYNNKALCLIEKKEFDSAFTYLKKSYTIDSINGSKRDMAANLIAFGQTYAGLNQFEKAASYYQRATNIFKKIKDKQGEYMAYGYTSDLYKQQNNWNKAYLYYDTAAAIKKEINTIKTNNKIATLEIEFETEKKNNTIHALTSKQTLTYSLLGLLVLMIISLGLYLTNLKSKSKIALQEQQEKYSLQIIEQEQKEQIRIAQELHDNIGQKLTVLKMYASTLLPDNNQFNNLIDETVTEVRGISHLMMPEIINLGLVKAIEKTCNTINSAGMLKCKLIVDGDLKSYEFNKQTNYSIFRIIQELLNNSLKHSKATEIIVHFKNIDGKIFFEVSDNGIGFDKKKINNNSGIGWSNIFTRAKIIKATLQITSDNKGTTNKLILSQHLQ